MKKFFGWFTVSITKDTSKLLILGRNFFKPFLISLQNFHYKFSNKWGTILIKIHQGVSFNVIAWPSQWNFGNVFNNSLETYNTPSSRDNCTKRYNGINNVVVVAVVVIMILFILEAVCVALQVILIHNQRYSSVTIPLFIFCYSCTSQYVLPILIHNRWKPGRVSLVAFIPRIM